MQAVIQQFERGVVEQDERESLNRSGGVVQKDFWHFKHLILSFVHRNSLKSGNEKIDFDDQFNQCQPENPF